MRKVLEQQLACQWHVGVKYPWQHQEVTLGEWRGDPPPLGEWRGDPLPLGEWRGDLPGLSPRGEGELAGRQHRALGCCSRVLLLHPPAACPGTQV